MAAPAIMMKLMADTVEQSEVEKLLVEAA